MQVLEDGIRMQGNGGPQSDVESLWLTLTASYAMDGKHAEGLATVEKALKALPPSAKLLVNKGSMLATLCRIEEAHTTFHVRSAAPMLISVIPRRIRSTMASRVLLVLYR